MKLVLTGLLLFLSVNILGQDYSSSVPRAVKYFESALSLYKRSGENAKVIEALDEAIKADPKFIEAHMLKANVYTDERNYDEAIKSYNSAIDINADFFPNNFYSLGKVEYLAGKYSDSRTHLEKFITYDKMKPNLVANAKKMIANSSFSEAAMNSPVPYSPSNMGDSINSVDEEYFAGMTADGKTFLFTRRLPAINSYGRKGMQEDFYTSKKIGNRWGPAQPLSEINTKGNEGAPSFSADGQYLFFTACQEMVPDMDAFETKGSCDIFLAKKIGEKFTKPRNLEVPINSGSWESQPSFSSDGRTLYFVRGNGSDQNGTHDILVSHINDNSTWSDPVSVSDLINTNDDEMSVFIHPDDQTLYFTSDGHPGLGGQDIFMSRRDSAGNWGKPVNLGYPINTIHNENSFFVSPDGLMAYFASNRKGGFGGLDLYQFPLYEKVRPVAVTYMKGKVYDEDTKKPLGAYFELIDLATGKVVVSSTANPGNGEFIVALPTGKSYALNVSKDGYLFYSDNFQLKNAKSSTEPFLKDVPMKPIKIGESIVLKNIFFDTDKFDLKGESRIELNKLVAFLNKNPSIKFEVSGHTDNVGQKPYNQTLSEKRAKSVYDYLLSKGIVAERMTSKGYGDTKPVADNTTDSGRAQNRRTEFLVTDVK